MQATETINTTPTHHPAMRIGGAAFIPGTCKPDAELLRLRSEFERARAIEQEAWAISEGSDSHELFDKAKALSDCTHAIIEKIEQEQSSTLDGLMLKVHALLHCTFGDPITIECLSGAYQNTTDMRLVVSIIKDLTAIASAAP